MATGVPGPADQRVRRCDVIAAEVLVGPDLDSVGGDDWPR